MFIPLEGRHTCAYDSRGGAEMRSLRSKGSANAFMTLAGSTAAFVVPHGKCKFTKHARHFSQQLAKCILIGILSLYFCINNLCE